MDKLTKTERSFVMSRIRSKGTKPELIVRRMIHRMGFRYRLHAKALPGKPDLVFASSRKVVFVHGCFWHGHKCRAGRNKPATNLEYWNPKLARNLQRDRLNSAKLRRQGWSVLKVWECQTKEVVHLGHRLRSFLEAT